MNIWNLTVKISYWNKTRFNKYQKEGYNKAVKMF